MKSTIDFEDIKRQAQDLQIYHNKSKELFKQYDDIFFMEDKEQRPQDRDPSDMKVTISPTGRNSVVGMVRLLRTATPKFKVTAEGGDTDKMENAMAKIVTESSRSMPFSSLSNDAFLSAVMHGPITAMVDSVDYLLKNGGLPAYEKERLKDIRFRAPFLLTVIPAAESFPRFNRYGLRAHLWRYKTTVEDVRERWGKDVLPTRKSSAEVNINDWYDMENRVVWVDGESKPIVSEKHGLPFIPIIVKVAGGSNLFDKPEKQIQSFLYSMNKAKLHQRETLIYTTFFTSLFERGAGLLVGIEPDPNNADQIVVNYSNGLRYIIGKVTPINDSGVDGQMINAKRMVDELVGQSTIHGQSLGEGVGANVPFSSLVTMAQTGRLPLVDAADAVGALYAEAGKIICKWIKYDGIVWDALKVEDIPDQFDITCEMEPDLPQDKLRNSTIAGALKGLVSKEWIHGNLLNITDSDAMNRAIMTETALDALFQEVMKSTLPQVLQVLNPQPPTPPAPQTGGQIPPEMMHGAGPQMMGGEVPGTAPSMPVPGMEAMPMTDPRMMGGMG